MKSSNWKLGTLATVALAATTFVSSQAQAGTISLVPSLPTITSPGDALGVDIVVDGLPSAAGGFSLDLDYGNLAFVGYVLGSSIPGGEWGAAPLDFSGDLGGTVSFAVLADALIAEVPLFVAQNSGGPFTIAHIDFTGVAAGAFTLDLKNVAVSNFLGDFDDPAFNLLICSGAGCNPTTSVPEPTTGLLVAAALGALGYSRRQKQAA